MKRKRAAERGGAAPAAPAPALKRGPWTPEEDEVLSLFVAREGEGGWRTLPRRAGLLRCGKSCRLRWMNYLRPDIKRGPIADDEEDLILRLHRVLGNRWSLIAGRLPGRTDNEIKNYWNSHLSKKLIAQGIDPRTHRPLPPAQVEPPPPVQPSSAAGTEGVGAAAGAFPAIVSPDVEGFEGLGDPFHAAADAALGGLDDLDRTLLDDDDDTFSSFLDSLINDDCFVGCFAQGGDGDHRDDGVHGENDQGGAS